MLRELEGALVDDTIEFDVVGYPVDLRFDLFGVGVAAVCPSLREGVLEILESGLTAGAADDDRSGREPAQVSLVVEVHPPLGIEEPLTALASDRVSTACALVRRGIGHAPTIGHHCQERSGGVAA